MSLDPEERPTAAQLVEFEHLRMGRAKASALFVSTENDVSDTETLAIQTRRIEELEQENHQLKQKIKELECRLQKSEINHGNS